MVFEIFHHYSFECLLQTLVEQGLIIPSKVAFFYYNPVIKNDILILNTVVEKDISKYNKFTFPSVCGVENIESRSRDFSGELLELLNPPLVRIAPPRGVRGVLRPRPRKPPLPRGLLFIENVGESSSSKV